ncbi:hypothetical protein L873DRAFT_901051 [Choiromyces venosus 120613-1]|uniref:Biogenesis of lysosome-related organelles complex 1 subunit CNL1 n=1 Tax=Choiromyces venosus 120613-1 TaxID=1336337 RepID=A0A3N4IWJ8_9PEZI|nr:hypothetical protein L873DRAFT_901051 [Choiromyces venosus 120613-1]
MPPSALHWRGLATHQPPAVHQRTMARRFRGTRVGREDNPLSGHLWDHVCMLDNRIAEFGKEQRELVRRMAKGFSEINAKFDDINAKLGNYR